MRSTRKLDYTVSDMGKRIDKAFNTVLLVGCLYEVFALVTRRVPTITWFIRWFHNHRIGRLLAWLWIGFVVDHFLVYDKDD